MKYQSIIQPRNEVSFPAFTGSRVYMREFFKRVGLPHDLAAYQPTIDVMLDGIETDQPIYIMIDESLVRAGQAQRRQGLHIDGYWNPSIQAHGVQTPSGHRAQEPSGHRARPSGHKSEPAPRGSHRDIPSGRHTSSASDWQHADFAAPEGLILASNICASRAYVGEFEGTIGEMGDCDHIDISHLDVIALEAGRVYAGNVTVLHESMPVLVDCQRQLVRLNVPGWTV